MLLVAQGLERCGVKTLAAGCQRKVDGEFPDHRLAGAGRRADQHAVAALERRAGPLLKVVERERQFRGEPGQLGQVGHAAADPVRERAQMYVKCGVSLHRHARSRSWGLRDVVMGPGSYGRGRLDERRFVVGNQRFALDFSLVVQPSDLDRELQQHSQRQP